MSGDRATPLRVRTYQEVTSDPSDPSDLARQVADQQARVDARLSNVRHIVAVMSGKGGVGKSFVTAALATTLTSAGRRVGVLDADLNGPTAARMLGAGREALALSEEGLSPAIGTGGVALVSMALLLEEGSSLQWREPEEASFVWRGAQERGALREFLADVRWGDRELLLVDLPPGVQRLLELHELVPRLSGALVVTIPSAASRDSVGRSMESCVGRGIPLLGIIENMAGYRCATCGEIGPLYAGSAGADLGRRFEVPVLARLPFDAAVGALAERGAFADLDRSAPAAVLLATAARRLLRTLDGDEGA